VNREREVTELEQARLRRLPLTASLAAGQSHNPAGGPTMLGTPAFGTPALGSPALGSPAPGSPAVSAEGLGSRAAAEPEGAIRRAARPDEAGAAGE
jgi:hypothetical protein